MKNFKPIFVLLTLLTSFNMLYAQNSKPVTDYFNVPGPVTFQKQPYHLSWSSHPSAAYYKQEYSPKGDSVAKFNSMILFEVLMGSATPKELMAAKLAELKKMKEANPVVQYESFGNAATGEYLLDFLLSANTPDGRMNIAERNVYRYKTFTNKQGQTGVLLFGVSTRSYGADIPAFLTALKIKKATLVNDVAKFTVPDITIGK